MDQIGWDTEKRDWIEAYTHPEWSGEYSLETAYRYQITEDINALGGYEGLIKLVDQSKED